MIYYLQTVVKEDYLLVINAIKYPRRLRMVSKSCNWRCDSSQVFASEVATALQFKDQKQSAFTKSCTQDLKEIKFFKF